jgi:hypothetical protein
MKKFIIYAIIAIAIIGTGYELFRQISGPNNVVFKQTIDSLHKENDSLKVEIVKETKQIDSMQVVETSLAADVDYQKHKVNTIVKYVDSSKKQIDNLSDVGLVHFYNSRYPQDTATRPLPIAQPILVLAAKDLVELDGDRQIIPFKDSIISLNEARLVNKDSIIGKYVSKETKYKLIITNKDTEITGWTNQYNQLQIQNKKLQLKSKFQKIGFYIILSGLTYMTLHK